MEIAKRVACIGRPAAVRRFLCAALAGLALAGCSPSPTPTQIGPPDAPGASVPLVAAGTFSDRGITLSAVAEPAAVITGEVIDVKATLSVDGHDDVELSGSGTGIVFFSVTRLEDGLTSGPPVMDGNCAPHRLTAGKPTVVPFSKSGGFSPEDENAAFLEAYFADPQLTLPPGTWRIDVATYGNIGPGCTGAKLDLDISLVVTVSE